MQVRGIVTPYFSDIRIYARTPRITEVPDPKHVVPEGLLALAEEMRPEATLLIGLS
jgi:hypothetical protein